MLSAYEYLAPSVVLCLFLAGFTSSTDIVRVCSSSQALAALASTLHVVLA